MKTLTIERNIDAPIQKVWDAWTDPEKLKEWFAPPGMHCPTISVDLTEGGFFRYSFKMDEGEGQFWGRGRYKTIAAPTFISYLDSFTDKDGNDVPASQYGLEGDDIIETLVEITLKEDGASTRLSMSAENPYDEKMEADMMAGWNGMFDKLATVAAH